MKIHAAPGSTRPGAWAHQYEKLLKLYEGSSPKIHTLCDTPEEADLIILLNVVQPEGNVLASHPLPRRFPEKCFLISEQWAPPFTVPGIYVNAPREVLWKGWFRTGSYALHHPDFKNPYVEKHHPKDTLPSAERKLLASFIGRNCHPVREALFSLKTQSQDIIIEDSSHFNAFSHDKQGKDAPQRRYYDIARQSKFILCPRGCGPSSIRLFEALSMSIAPVIISDAWIPVEGPNWEDFSIRVKEKDINSIESILRERINDFERLGINARKAHETFFAEPVYFNQLVKQMVSIRKSRFHMEIPYLAVSKGIRTMAQAGNKIIKRLVR